MLVGKRDYGSYKTGASVYKDSKGYYIVEWSLKEEKEYKKYLKSWVPPKNSEQLCLVKKRWTSCKKASKKASKNNKTRKTR